MVAPVRRRRLTRLLVVAAVYLAGTLGLARLIGVYFSPVRCVLFGATMLAAWLAARWIARHVPGGAAREQR
ncbi:MAG TPA: hypothetical protein VMC03_00610 [Streptosporangiaceae bacterium]|nr:hypothetical protein [Streptosporangiaceae bacterium]